MVCTAAFTTTWAKACTTAHAHIFTKKCPKLSTTGYAHAFTITWASGCADVMPKRFAYAFTEMFAAIFTDTGPGIGK